MITKSNLQEILSKLNSLEKKNLNREFTIFDSAALMIQELASADRATQDIDMVDPEIDTDLQLISMDISKDLGLEISWLNSAGYIFSKNFPQGWKERAILKYSGSNLKVYTLSRKDLIASKVLAYCQRLANTDLIDLKSLAPKQNEIIFIENWLKKRPDFNFFKLNLIQLKNELQKL